MRIIKDNDWKFLGHEKGFFVFEWKGKTSALADRIMVRSAKYVVREHYCFYLEVIRAKDEYLYKVKMTKATRMRIERGEIPNISADLLKVKSSQPGSLVNCQKMNCG